MKLSILGAAVATAALALGVSTQLFSVHASELPDEAKNTTTEVKLINNPDPNNVVLKLVHVPEQYSFSTTLLSTGEYSITGGKVEKGANIRVFNDRKEQPWSVKASIANTKLETTDNKTATVNGFTINGQQLMGQKTDQIVHKSAELTEANNTGNIDKAIVDGGLSISFVNSANDLKSGDVLKGTVRYQLYNTVDAK